MMSFIKLPAIVPHSYEAFPTASRCLRTFYRLFCCLTFCWFKAVGQ